MSEIDIIIPTWNLPQYAVPCVKSILRDLVDDSVHIYVVNNGDEIQEGYFPKDDRLTILNQKENLGWEGGLKAGLAVSKADFVVFMNDDTFVPVSSRGWLGRLMALCMDERVGAVGPASNVVMGVQNTFIESELLVEVPYLIGFCMMVKRSVLDEAGGVDDSLPGGDDLDLSLRIRKLGKSLVCDKSVFIYHHGFKSGERLLGDSTVKGGWNSVEMLERTNFALIEKHGLKGFLSIHNGLLPA